MDTNNQSLLEALGVAEMTPEEQEIVIEDVSALISQGATVRLLEQMDESTRAAFTQLMESDASETEVMAFLRERVPGADQAVEDTIRELRDDILAATDDASA